MNDTHPKVVARNPRAALGKPLGPVHLGMMGAAAHMPGGQILAELAGAGCVLGQKP